MLPSGHIAGGYLAAYSLIKIFHPQLSETEFTQLLWCGVFFGFAPDLDMFFSFIRQKSCTIQRKYNHRKLYSHTPLVWLIAGGIVMLFSQNLFMTYAGLVI